MAHIGYMTITGKTQGLISSGCNSKDSVGEKAQSSHLNEITVLACHHDMSKFHADMPKENGAITITKPIDKSSPLLGSAFSKQEHLDIEIKFYRTNASGSNEHFYSIELVQAVVSGLSFSQPHANFSNDEDLNEQVSFRYKDIIWKHLISGTEGYDIW